MYKHYRNNMIAAPDGTLQCYIKMDPEFIAPVKDVEFGWICPDGTPTSDPLGDFTSGKTTYSFNICDLSSVTQRIEKIVRKAGLRKTRGK